MIPKKKHEEANIIISDVANGDKNNNGTSPMEILETIETLEEGIVSRKGSNADSMEINYDTNEMNFDTKKNANLINQVWERFILFTPFLPLNLSCNRPRYQVQISRRTTQQDGGEHILLYKEAT